MNKEKQARDVAFPWCFALDSAAACAPLASTRPLGPSGSSFPSARSCAPANDSNSSSNTTKVQRGPFQSSERSGFNQPTALSRERHLVAKYSCIRRWGGPHSDFRRNSRARLNLPRAFHCCVAALLFHTKHATKTGGMVVPWESTSEGFRG